MSNQKHTERAMPEEEIEQYGRGKWGWEIQQDQAKEIADLKVKLSDMEQCYIQIKQEHNELIAVNTAIERKQKSAENTAKKYKLKVSMIADLLRDTTEKDMTLEAIKTVIDQVGEP